jgi:hypothetical protein
MTMWKDEVDRWLDQYLGDKSKHAMAEANRDMVVRVVGGMGPDKPDIDSSAGAHVVFNIAAVHVSSFCRPGGTEKPYKNTYDLVAQARLGGAPAKGPSALRTVVDQIIEHCTSLKPDNLYFGAVEVNGSGIRFYGDICLVLKSTLVDAGTTVLNSNSYDLIRPPSTPAGAAPYVPGLQKQLSEMIGKWSSDLGSMAVLKTFDALPHTSRRLTTGAISGAILDDEDYLEVLKIDTFSALDLQEARVSAPDTAAEMQIGERTRLGPCPSMGELQWRKQRLAANRALNAEGVAMRVVTTNGRVRA